MVTENEFRKAQESLRANSKDIMSKWTIASYHLEHQQLTQARPYIKEIFSLLNREQLISLFDLLYKEITRLQNTYNGYTDEDISHLIASLQKLHEQKVKNTDSWLTQEGQSYQTLLKWADRHPQALLKLGDMHYKGTFGTPKNHEAAIHCLEKSYDQQRDANTANLIGCVYDAEKQHPQALKYFRIASDGGSQYGSYNAALTYQLGEGTVPKNLNEAARYYKKATEQAGAGQYPKAHYQLGKVYQSLYQEGKTPTIYTYRSKDFMILAKEEYQKAADHQYGDAAYELAKIYQAERNEPQASRYFKQAANAGNAEALYHEACLYETLKRYDEAFKHFYLAYKKNHAPSKEKLTDKKTRLSGYFTLYQALEKENDTFDVVFQAMRPYLRLQQALQYDFINAEFLLDALDRGIDAETKEAPFQKLEFLGDSVLATSIREYFIDKNPEKWRVGDFEYATQALLSNTTVLPTIAKQLGLANLITCDKTESAHTLTDKMLADAMEALIGAMFQDYGFSKTTNSTSYYMKARTVVQELWRPWLEAALAEQPRSAVVAAAPKTVAPSVIIHKPTAAGAPATPSYKPPQHPQPQQARATHKPPKAAAATSTTATNGRLSPATQRAFSATGGGTTPQDFEKALPKMSDINRRNIGKKGDTVLMTLIRKEKLRPEKEIPKIHAALKYGALWSASNNKGETAETLLSAHPKATTKLFGK